MKHAPRGRIKARKASQRHPMSAKDPMSTYVGGDALHGRQQCTARSKQTGRQCGRTAILGGTVCRYHGGLAPQVKRAAERRLEELRPLAIRYYDYLLSQDEYPSAGLRAANAVMDRVDGKPAERTNVTHDGTLVVKWQS